MTRVKICGCMRPEDVIAAKEGGADFVGFMFAPGSKRRLSFEEAQILASTAGIPLRDLGQDEPPPSQRGRAEDAATWFAEGARALERMLQRKRPLTVGVFENQPLEEVNQIADEVGIDLIQLSGHESWEDCLLANRQVVKTLDVQGRSPLQVIDGVHAGAGIACLLDSSRGRGIEGDAGFAAELSNHLPLWLAGGLTPENVGLTIQRVRPWAVDVSSGVEMNGKKDPRKIGAFIEAARRVNSLERSA